VDCELAPGQITILIPVFNARHTISACIESAASQDHFGCSIVVSDNCSTDGTVGILHQLEKTIPNLRLILNPENMGSWLNFKGLIDQCQTEMALFLGADDCIDKSYVSRCISEFRVNRDVALVAGGCTFIDRKNKRWPGILHNHNQHQGGARVSDYYWKVKDNSIFYGIFRTSVGQKFFNLPCMFGGPVGADQAFVAYLAMSGKIITLNNAQIIRGYTEDSQSTQNFPTIASRYKHMQSYISVQLKFLYNMKREKKISACYFLLSVFYLSFRVYIKWNLSIARLALRQKVKHFCS